MLPLYAFIVLLVPAVVSGNDGQYSVNTPQDCNVNTYDNNGGPQKDVLNLLTDIKKQLDELQSQVALLARCNSKGRDFAYHNNVFTFTD
ncbi:hypothetical protein OS493_037235 [Desmophyllum pertusum]|uniref:Uncharacterized protein n=1 Tax=Desmophyllum pertusum TaxID=174260 RepID=A0A9W9ZHY5_9CNID|nr:hypothetical protein OS493_037235 [Desmophyllum pertusum]